MNKIWKMKENILEQGSGEKLKELDLNLRRAFLTKIIERVENIKNSLERKDKAFHVGIARIMELVNILSD